MYIYIYIYTHLHIHVIYYIYIYMYTYMERERERERCWSIINSGPPQSSDLVSIYRYVSIDIDHRSYIIIEYSDRSCSS